MSNQLVMNPKIWPRPEHVVKPLDKISEMDSVEAYKAGYLDGIRSVSDASYEFVRALRNRCLNDSTVLKALLIAIDEYSIGGGVEHTAAKLNELLKGQN